MTIVARPAGKMKMTASVIFLTGLSSSGKTTIATSLQQKLKCNGISALLLDSDEIRNAQQLNDFDEASRKKHNIHVGGIASLLESQGNTVIVALIAPYAETRDQIRKMCSSFIEVYVSADIQVCMQRDIKGLYKKALKGEISDFTGISAPYFPPLHPEITLDTSILNVEECTDQILAFINNQK